MSSLMHLDYAHDEEIELYCDEAMDFCAPLFAIPSLPRSSSATDLHYSPLSASPLPRSASAEPLRPLSRSSTPSFESPARKRASPCPSHSPHQLLQTPPLLLADDDISFLLASEYDDLEPLLSVPQRSFDEALSVRPEIVTRIFSVAAAYHADSCIPFQALSLLDRVLALHSCCPEPPAPSDAPLVAFASSSHPAVSSTSSTSPLSSATTPVLSRNSPIFQPLQPQQHHAAQPLHTSPHLHSAPHSSASRCHTPLTMLSNEFSVIMVNACPSPQPAATFHSPGGRALPFGSSGGDKLRSPTLLSRKRPAALTGILFDHSPGSIRAPVACAVCSLASRPCVTMPFPRMIRALSAAALLVSFKFIVDGPVPNAREYAALFDISTEQLKLAELDMLHALDWRVRYPTACDYLHVLVERERCAGLLPLPLLQQLQQHSEYYCVKFLQTADCCRFLPSETAAAAWRESLSLWNIQGGRSADIAAALAARRSARAPVLAAAMAAVKAAVIAEIQPVACAASTLQCADGV